MLSAAVLVAGTAVDPAVTKMLLAVKLPVDQGTLSSDVVHFSLT